MELCILYGSDKILAQIGGGDTVSLEQPGIKCLAQGRSDDIHHQRWGDGGAAGLEHLRQAVLSSGMEIDDARRVRGIVLFLNPIVILYCMDGQIVNPPRPLYQSACPASSHFSVAPKT